MTIHPSFDAAVELLDAGEVKNLQLLLARESDLATARDYGNATLLIRLIDWPGHRPLAADSARLLLEAGAEVDARRDERNGTALAGALCTEEVDLLRVLIEFGADIQAPCGWQDGNVLELADRICQNLERAGEPVVKTIAALFGDAAGRPIPSRVPLGGTTPLLFVDDVPEGIRYYGDNLGFHLNWEYNESKCEDQYASISRGGAEFHITNCLCDDRRHIGRLQVRIAAEPIDPLFLEIRDRVQVREEPVNRSYGLREFEIEDPWGNRLVFFGNPVRDDETGV